MMRTSSLGRPELPPSLRCICEEEAASAEIMIKLLCVFEFARLFVRTANIEHTVWQSD